MVPTSSRALSSVSLPAYFGVDHALETEPCSIARDDMIIAVMGPTGAGKSSFINIATQSTSVAVGHGLESCTQVISAYGCRHPDRNRNVVFVDTPGFDDTNRSDGDILKAIANWLVDMYKQKITLSGILYLHRISDNRIAGTPLRNLEVFQDLCGPMALANVIFTTTHWNEVEESVGQARQAELTSTYWGPMLNAGSRTSRFDRTYTSAWDIVQMFHPVLQPLPLLLQIEMVDQGKMLAQTSAGLTLLGKLARLIAEIRRVIQWIEKKLGTSARTDSTALFDEKAWHQYELGGLIQQEQVILSAKGPESRPIIDGDERADDEIHSGASSAPCEICFIGRHLNPSDGRPTVPPIIIRSDSDASVSTTQSTRYPFPSLRANASTATLTSPQNLTPTSFSRMFRRIWSEAPRFNAGQSLLSAATNPTDSSPSRPISFSQALQPSSEAVEDLHPICTSPVHPTVTTHVAHTSSISSSASLQAQGVSRIESTAMTDIREEIQAVHHAVTRRGNGELEFRESAVISERTRTDFNLTIINIHCGDRYNGHFTQANIGGHHAANSVTSHDGSPS
ncbi:hypothetical protein ONZ45_g10072 [Pleurotus djamor]|nr:hypothetical protein ONZ45_g10072 [Pleurotus djamor]